MKLRNCRIKDINELVTMVEQNNSALSFLAIHKKENITVLSLQNRRRLENLMI